MELKSLFAQDNGGNAIPGAVVHIYDYGTTNLAKGVTTISGAALVSPFAAEANGLIQFRAPNGTYDVHIKSDQKTYTLAVQCIDLVPGSFVTPEEYGAVGDGTSNDGEALQRMEQYAYENNKVMYFAKAYLTDRDLQFRRRTYANVGATILAIANGDTVPTRRVSFERKCDIEGFVFNYINVDVPSTASEQLSMMSTIRRNSFINSPLSCGQTLVPTFGYDIRDNDHVWTLSRNADAVTLTNVSLSNVSGRMQSFRRAVNIVVTRSFACDSVVIGKLEATNCFEGVRAIGSSMFRITNLEFNGTIISSSARDAQLITSGGIIVTWAVGVKFKGVNANSNGDVVKLQACLDIFIDNETRLESTGNQGACVRASGCSGGKILGASMRSNTGYLAIIGSATLNPITTGNIYPSKNWLIQGCEGLCDALGIYFIDTVNAQAISNQITSRIAAPSGLVRFNANCTGKYYDNRLTAPSGIGVQNLAGGNVTQGINSDTLIVSALPAPVISAPVITNVDSALDDSKSYMVQFTLGHYTHIRQLADDTAPKKLSDWMATVTGSKTLGWNSAAWEPANTNKIADIVVNGITYDNFGTERWWSMKSMLVIDRQSKLTCRNWASPSAVSPNAPPGVSARQITEQAWQTASFRPPLVVDAAIYDPVPSGLTTFNDYAVVRSGRTALGQKADGTYVLLVVDGKTNVNGTTSAKVAAKMLALGCQNAFMLDGGGSSTLWYNGAVINSPSDDGGERLIPVCMYV